jgi:hypothetical protein
MEKEIDHAREGRILNIKKKVYIYSYKHYNKLIDEQRADGNNHKLSYSI